VHRDDLARRHRRQVGRRLGVDQAAVVEAQLARIGAALDHRAPERAATNQRAAALDARAAHHGRQFLQRELEVHASNQMWMLPVPRAFS
jgi:hypothetical protein